MLFALISYALRCQPAMITDLLIIAIAAFADAYALMPKAAGHASYADAADRC